ncbi:MAG: ATP-binding protein [bacterium]|nr:ATP-binding protein [bacterium]
MNIRTTGPPTNEIVRLLRKFRRTFVIATVIPLLALLSFVFLLLPSDALATGRVAAILAAVLVLMLMGVLMILRVTAVLAGAVRGDGAAPPPSAGRRSPAGRSIRHTVAEACALIGAIPLLALGYIVARYAAWEEIQENMLLLTCIVSAVLILGLVRVNGITRRMLSIAAVARSARNETAPAERGAGVDEIGALAADIAQIAGNLSARTAELRRATSFVDRLPHPILVVDPAGNISSANLAARRLLGYRDDELLGRRASSLFALAAEQEWIAGRRDDAERENIWRCRDGIPVRVSVRVGPLPEEDGGGSVLVATDITDLKLAEEESMRLRRELAHVSRVSSLGVFAASLAHEINQPLAAILNNAQACVKLMERDPPDMAEIRGALEDIIADDNRASEVIRGLNSLLRRTEHAHVTIAVNGMVMEIVRFLERDSQLRNIPIVCKFAPDLPPVQGDVIHLQQIVLNLILNSFEAIARVPGAPRVVVVETAREEADGVRISVRDTGRGIREEDMPRIFEPFYTTKPGGLGMGLPISRMIVEEHEGRLWAENNADGGATFHVVLPIAGEVT